MEEEDGGGGWEGEGGMKGGPVAGDGGGLVGSRELRTETWFRNREVPRGSVGAATSSSSRVTRQLLLLFLHGWVDEPLARPACLFKCIRKCSN